MVRLTAEQKKFYKDNGYIHLKNVFSKEDFEKITDEYDKLFKRKNLEEMENSWVGDNNGKDNRKTDSPYTVKGVHNLQQHHAVFGRLFLYNDNLLDAVQDCIGSENVMLHHTKAHFKPPENGAEYPMHQDYPYFPHERDAIVAAFIHLDASNPENGGLCVYPGSHKLGPLEDVGPVNQGYHYVDKQKWPLSKATPVNADRGDVVIFSYLLVHGSPLNKSTRPRRMLLAEFLDPDNKPLGYQQKQPGYGWMLRGVNYNKDAQTSSRFEYD